MVRVLPKNDSIRKLIKHPVGGPFRGEGSSEWPNDSFTARRIADGDVTVEVPHQVEKKETKEELVAEKNEQPEKKEEQPEKKSRSRAE